MSKCCGQARKASSQLVPLSHRREARYQQPWFESRARHLSASPPQILPTFTALLLIGPVGTVPLLVADSAELDAGAVLSALELCRAHCKEGENQPAIRCTGCCDCLALP